MDVRLMSEINYNPLRGKIRECGLTQKGCAAKIGLSEGQLNRKLAGEYNFKQSEIHNLCDLLDIDAKEIGYYFFCPKS